MSYCRFSDNDYQCDVYVYSDVGGGITTHVAGRRFVISEPLPESIPFSPNRFEEWYARHEKVMSLLDSEKMVKIGLQHDGKTFNHDTPTECANFLIELRDMGYNIPQYAIDALIDEVSLDNSDAD